MTIECEYSVQTTSWYKKHNVLIIKNQINNREIFFTGISVKVFEMIDNGYSTNFIIENLKNECGCHLEEVQEILQMFVKFKIIKPTNQFEENNGGH